MKDPYHAFHESDPIPPSWLIGFLTLVVVAVVL